MDTLSMLILRFNGYFIPFTHFISFHFTDNPAYRVPSGYKRPILYYSISLHFMSCDRVLFICRYNKQTSGTYARICYDDKRAYAPHQIVKIFSVTVDFVSNHESLYTLSVASFFFLSFFIFHFISFLVNFYFYYYCHSPLQFCHS